MGELEVVRVAFEQRPKASGYSHALQAGRENSTCPLLGLRVSLLSLVTGEHSENSTGRQGVSGSSRPGGLGQGLTHTD